MSVAMFVNGPTIDEHTYSTCTVSGEGRQSSSSPIPTTHGYEVYYDTREVDEVRNLTKGE